MFEKPFYVSRITHAPLEYARLCAGHCAVLFPATKLKGRGHEERVRVDRDQVFLALLPSAKIKTRNDYGSIRAQHFTSAAGVTAYRADLLYAGLNPDTQTHQLNDHGRGAAAACALARTTKATALAPSSRTRVYPARKLIKCAC